MTDLHKNGHTQQKERGACICGEPNCNIAPGTLVGSTSLSVYATNIPQSYDNHRTLLAVQNKGRASYLHRAIETAGIDARVRFDSEDTSGRCVIFFNTAPRTLKDYPLTVYTLRATDWLVVSTDHTYCKVVSDGQFRAHFHEA